MKPNHTLLFLRLVVCFCLIGAAVVIGTLFYHFLHHEETLLFEAQYKSISNEALDRALELVQRQSSAGLAFSSLYSTQNPELSEWPNATIVGPMEAGERLTELSGIHSYAYAPLVYPHQVASFEAFAFQYFASDPNIPNTTGYHEFGTGIFNYDMTSNYSDGRVPDKTGENNFGSPYRVLFPLLHHPYLYTIWSPWLTLLNWRYNAVNSRALDAVLDCALASDDLENCGIMTDFIELSIDRQPAVILFHPVYPANDLNRTIVGVTGTVVTFLNLFEGAVPNYVPGIHAVLSTSTSTYTYIIKNGEPIFIGEGDKHLSKYNHYRYRRHLTASGIASTSARYILEFYPTDEYVSYYHTDRPLIISLTSAAIIIFTSLVFLIYDYCMKKVSNEQLELLEAKRKFVRFISHEVRTPLNTISLGAKLLNMQLHKMVNIAENTANAVDIIDCIELSEELLDGTDSAVMALNDMIRYDEIDIGVLRLDATLIPIIDLLRTVKKSYDIVAREKQIDYRFNMKCTSGSDAGQLDIEADSYRVVGDEMQILHVFRNLLSNAFNHTDNRGMIRLEYEWIADGLAANVKSAFSEDDTCKYPRAGSILISVIDTGVGMSAEQVSLLMNDVSDISSSVKTIRPELVTSGHGLVAAKRIVRHHAGVFNISSRGVGYGCCFSVELPVYVVTAGFRARSNSTVLSASRRSAAARALGSHRIAPVPNNDLFVSNGHGISVINSEDLPLSRSSGEDAMPTLTPNPAAEPIETAPNHQQSEKSGQTSKNVLVVDDAPSTRKILCRLLRNNGHTCSEADNGAKAVSAYIYCDERSPFDAILMDYEMPVLNGPTATRILRSLGFTNPIIGITGNVLPEDVRYFKSNGANEVLAKPLKVPELEAIWNDAKVGYTVTTPELEDTGVYRKIMSERRAASVENV